MRIKRLLAVFLACVMVFAMVPAVQAAEYKIFEVTDNLPTAETIRNYQFTLPKDGRISLDFNHVFINDGLPFWRIIVFSNTWEAPLLDFESLGSTPNINRYIGYVAAGTYYIRVQTAWGHVHSNVDYALTVNYTENTGAFEVEPNGTMATATEINVNSEITGNLLSGEDIDFYKFTLPKDGRISLNFRHEFINDGLPFWRIILFDTSWETPLLDFESLGNTPNLNRYIGYVAAGTYYIRVQTAWGHVHSNVDYALTVNNDEITNFNTNITGGEVSIKIDFGEKGYLLFDKDTMLFNTNLKVIINKKNVTTGDAQAFFTALNKFLSQ
jgi:hypothetical protein